MKNKLKEIAIEGADVLNVACGTGRWSRISAELGANKVIGLDLSPDQIEKAKSGACQTLQRQQEAHGANAQNSKKLSGPSGFDRLRRASL